jgi:ribosomal protein S18 acetylase RimI-like enzyme
MITIRKAERRDMPAVGRLGAMLIRTHHAFDSKRFLAPIAGTEEGYAAYLGNLLDSNEDCIFVADRDGEVAGYVWADLEPMSWKELRGPAGFVQDLIVAEDARRRGIATQLLRAAMDWLREHGAPRVILWTAAPNEAARALFRRAGFRDTMVEMTCEL